MKFNPTTLVLASGSPRRKDLLTQAGYRFKILVPSVDESFLASESPQAMVERLAKVKAQESAKLYFKKKHPSAHRLFISADTTVVIKNKILSKPESTREALQMLQSLQNKKHRVLTSFCILAYIDQTFYRQHLQTVTTEVEFKSLSASMIAQYIKTKEPMDKAGAYAAQGIGMSFIQSIQGSYTNVVGLPMAEVTEAFQKKFNYHPLWIKSKP